MGLFNLFGKPSHGKFARLMTKALLSEGYEKSIEYDEDTFSLILDKQSRLFLGNVYSEYVDSHYSERKFILNKYAIATITLNQAPVIPQSFEEGKSHLLPRIRNNAYYQYNDMMMRADGINRLPFLYKPFTHHLCVELCYDMKHSTCAIAEEHLSKWGIGFNDVFMIAKDNMWSISNEDFNEVHPGVYLSPWQDAHDASRMILHDLIWQYKVKGDPVITVPDRDHLLLTGSEDLQGLEALAALTKEVIQNTNRHITGQAYRLEGTTWKPFMPGADHPAYAGLREVRSLSRYKYYDNQKAAMEKLQPEEFGEHFVASILYCQDKNSQSEFTLCAWSDAPTLLPRTDRIALSNPDAEVEGLVVNWEDAEKIVGHLMKQRKDLIPTRYEVNELPSTAQMQQLKECRIRASE